MDTQIVQATRFTTRLNYARQARALLMIRRLVATNVSPAWATDASKALMPTLQNYARETLVKTPIGTCAVCRSQGVGAPSLAKGPNSARKRIVQRVRASIQTKSSAVARERAATGTSFAQTRSRTSEKMVSVQRTPATG